MCGICGVFDLQPGRRVEREVLAAMSRQIVHRGPDEDGFFVEGNVGLAVRRLKIIDLATGSQPITNESGTVHIVYNGEIYNHRELRSGLEGRGHRFRSRSDTETIVHLYEEHGRACVHHLRGMFAFALWDADRRRLLLARDRLGIKPLHYCLLEDALVFGSEMKAILAHPGIRAGLNAAYLPEYLAFGYLANSDSLFRGIQKLMPGCTLEVGEDGRVDVQQYWDPAASAPSNGLPGAEYARAYRSLLEEAVSLHLMSDVPLGVFLSGGIDSSTVAAMMTRERREPVATFSVGYNEERQSELGYARLVAQHLDSEHHEVIVTDDDFFSSLPKLIWHEDEPIVWPSSVSLYFVAKLAREHVTVVLTGEGSDETLGGYARYAWTLRNSHLNEIYRRITPESLRRFVRGYISQSGLLRADLRRKLQHTFLGRDASQWPFSYFEDYYAAFSEREQEALLMDELRAAPGAAYRNSLELWQRSSGDPLSRLLYTDIKSYLVELLMKQDSMSMAASVESRVPFLDHKVVEFALSIPPSFKLNGLHGKQILKDAVRDLLPEEILRRRKMGFPTPIRQWLRGPRLDAVERIVAGPRSLERKLFKPHALRQLFGEHRTRMNDHTDRIWRLLNLEHWCRVFLDREPVAEVERLS